VVGDVVKNLDKNGYGKSYLLPFSIDIDIYKKLNVIKEFDVFSVFTTGLKTYPNRNAVLKLVSSLKEFKTFTKKVQHEVYINNINKSRVCITSNNKFKSLSIKYTEILACGSFMLADRPEDFDELGYVDGTHLVIYNDLNDLKDKINYYVKNYKSREKIARQGMEFVREFHNNSVRVQQFTEIVKNEFNIK
jgi:spore maturation protein CgeB